MLDGWINQHTVWVAAMISAAAGCLSLLIALIVNREKLAEFFYKYWGVVLVAFAVAGGWSFYDFGGLMYLANLRHRFTEWMSKDIPIWSVFIVIAVFLGFRWVWRKVAKRPEPNNNAPTPNNPPVPPSQLSPEDFLVEHYTEDLIDGVWWQWTYSGHTVEVPRPICPNKDCQCDLVFRQDWNRIYDAPNIAHIGAPPVTLHCPRCPFKMDFNKTENQVLHDVMQEILSQIRTNRFRGRLYNRAKNQQSEHN
jgi:hypothetical protein